MLCISYNLYDELGMSDSFAPSKVESVRYTSNDSDWIVYHIGSVVLSDFEDFLLPLRLCVIHDIVGTAISLGNVKLCG